MALDPCSVARAHLSCHLDEQPLPWLVRAVVRFHLFVCPPCRRVARSLAATRDALEALRDNDVDEGG